MPRTHHLDDSRVHCNWDNSIPPLLDVEPGDTVVFETREASDRQIGPDSSVEALASLSFDPIHPLTGPVKIRGAEPGDTLAVEILDVRPKAWGWSAIIPGFGLLGQDPEFQEPYLKIWDLSAGDRAEFKPGIVVPFEPFCGIMGVAPAEPGSFTTIAPRRNGGNIDIKQLVKGTTAFFPVLVDGANFSCGDVHAAQGDGEVCGTGIECDATVTLRFDLQKGRELPELAFRMAGPMPGGWNEAGWHVATAHAPDLMVATHNAIRHMIRYVGAEHGLTPPEALVLCSVAVDLKISEVVDAPNWIVSAALPLGIFAT